MASSKEFTSKEGDEKQEMQRVESGMYRVTQSLADEAPMSKKKEK